MQFVAMSTDQARLYRAGEPDANGRPPEKHVAEGATVPCRHCMGFIPQGAPMLVLAHRPFATRQPYAEVGPVFLCAEACARGDGAAPPKFLIAAQYIVRGYSADERIIYGTGSVVPTGGIEARAAALFDDPAVAFVHVRSASNNCFYCRIERD